MWRRPRRSTSAWRAGSPSVRAMGTLATRLTLLASVLCIVVAVPALYARSAVLDRDHFADRAVSALASDEVDDEIATRFSAGLIERSPGLVTLRPALEDGRDRGRRDPRLRGGVRERRAGPAPRDLQRGRPAARAAGGRDDRRGAGGPRAPHAGAGQAGAGGRRPVADVDRRERARAPAARRGPACPQLVAPGAARAGHRAARARARRADRAEDRRRGLWRSGIALATSGGVLLAGWIGARTLTLEGFDTSWGDAVVKTIWSAYLGDLRTWSSASQGAGIDRIAAARPATRR